MTNKPFSLEQRTITFSKDVIYFCQTVKATPIVNPIVSQLIRSATSIGANYAEAINASSKADFRNKIFISKKEAAETKYWFTLIEGLVDNKAIIINLKQECQFILMTLQKIINTMRTTEKSKQKTENGIRA